MFPFWVTVGEFPTQLSRGDPPPTRAPCSGHVALFMYPEQCDQEHRSVHVALVSLRTGHQAPFPFWLIIFLVLHVTGNGSPEYWHEVGRLWMSPALLLQLPPAFHSCLTNPPSMSPSLWTQSMATPSLGPINSNPTMSTLAHLLRCCPALGPYSNLLLSLPFPFLPDSTSDSQNHPFTFLVNQVISLPKSFYGFLPPLESIQTLPHASKTLHDWT